MDSARDDNEMSKRDSLKSVFLRYPRDGVTTKKCGDDLSMFSSERGDASDGSEARPFLISRSGGEIDRTSLSISSSIYFSSSSNWSTF